MVTDMFPVPQCFNPFSGARMVQGLLWCKKKNRRASCGSHMMALLVALTSSSTRRISFSNSSLLSFPNACIWSNL